MSEMPAAGTKMSDLIPLNSEQILRLWTKTYNTEGKPDWSHIFPYYHEDIVFQDSIQTIRGKTDFIAMCNRLTERCEQLNMEIVTVAETTRTIMFDWKMTMIFKKFPSTPIFGSTKLTLDEHSMIVHQRDYFDIWGDIFNGIPFFKRSYRKFMHRYFG